MSYDHESEEFYHPKSSKLINSTIRQMGSKWVYIININ